MGCWQQILCPKAQSGQRQSVPPRGSRRLGEKSSITTEADQILEQRLQQKIRVKEHRCSRRMGVQTPSLLSWERMEFEQLWVSVQWVFVPTWPILILPPGGPRPSWMPHLLAMLMLSSILSIKFSQESLPSLPRFSFLNVHCPKLLSPWQHPVLTCCHLGP